MSAVPKRIVLVGLSGAGKSTAGRLAAEQLAARGTPWEFVDLDAEIERRAGRPVAEIFARQGEAAFRKLERAVSLELLGRDQLLLATGGGWVELGEPVERFRAVSELVYLQVSPRVAAARIGAEGGGRPLLAGPEPAKRLENLLQRREGSYLQSQHTLSVDSMSPEQVASYIVALASADAGD
jgi:shikimate kinase